MPHRTVNTSLPATEARSAAPALRLPPPYLTSHRTRNHSRLYRTPPAREYEPAALPLAASTPVHAMFHQHHTPTRLRREHLRQHRTAPVREHANRSALCSIHAPPHSHHTRPRGAPPSAPHDDATAQNVLGRTEPAARSAASPNSIPSAPAHHTQTRPWVGSRRDRPRPLARSRSTVHWHTSDARSASRIRGVRRGELMPCARTGPAP
jgi:hypothetical protein